MKTILLTIIVFAVAMGIMAVGVILCGRCLRGSCGGPERASGDGTCGVCGRKKESEPE